MPDNERLEDLLELMRAEAKRVERSARIVKQLAARAQDAAAAANQHSPKEDTAHVRDQDQQDRVEEAARS